MRIALIALALIAAACSPPAPQDAPAPPATDAAPVAPAHRDTAALGATPAAGAWTFRVDEGVSAAGFGLPESEHQFIVACEAASGKLTITYEHELLPDQDTTLRLITAVQSIDLPARSFNEGLPAVTAEIRNDDRLKPLLIGMLGAPTDRFAADVAGQSQVFPWDGAVAQALTACR